MRCGGGVHLATNLAKVTEELELEMATEANSFREIATDATAQLANFGLLAEAPKLSLAAGIRGKLLHPSKYSLSFEKSREVDTPALLTVPLDFRHVCIRGVHAHHRGPR